MSASKNKSKSAGLRFLWIPGRKKHGHKGRYDTTNKQVSYPGSFGNKNNAPWSLGGSKGLEKLTEPDIPGSAEGASRIIAALPTTYTIAGAAGASTTVMKLDDANQFSILDEKNEKEPSNDLNCSKSEDLNADKQCHVDRGSQDNQETVIRKGDKTQNGERKEIHSEKSKDGINSIESLHEKKLNNSTFDIADSSLYVNKYSGKKKKNKKKKKESLNNDDDVKDDPDAQIVKCLYFTLMCCECTIS